MSLEEEKRLSRELYNRHGFLKTIISLYVEGVTWGGCKLIYKVQTETNETVVDINADSLKLGVQNMLVDGQGDYHLNISGEERVIIIPMLPDYPFDRQGGHPLLWPVTRNAVPLDSIMSSITKMSPDGIKSSRILLDDICSGIGIPYAFLVEDPITFANTLAIKNVLRMFKHKVDNIRRSVEFGFRQFAKQLGADDVSIDVNWNDDWPSRDENGSAYQIFKTLGIDLVTLQKEELATTKWAYENSFISRQTYDEKVKYFI